MQYFLTYKLYDCHLNLVNETNMQCYSRTPIVRIAFRILERKSRWKQTASRILTVIYSTSHMLY